MFSMLHRHHPKVDSYSTTKPLYRTSSQWAKLHAVHLTIHLLARETAKCMAIYHFTGCSQWSGQMLRKIVTGKLVTNTLDKEVLHRPLHKGEECKITCVPCKCSSKGDLGRRGL